MGGVLNQYVKSAFPIHPAGPRSAIGRASDL